VTKLGGGLQFEQLKPVKRGRGGGRMEAAVEETGKLKRTESKMLPWTKRGKASSPCERN